MDARNHVTEYWEQTSHPRFTPYHPFDLQSLINTKATSDYIQSILENPYFSRERIENYQFQRIKELVQRAYYKIPLYKDKYKSVGFEPGDLKTWNDYHHLPIVTKEELHAAFPSRCTEHKQPNQSILFKMHSSGSTGQSLLFFLHPETIAEYTIRYIRQFYLQSSGAYRDISKVALVTTVPWWTSNVRNGYQHTFISSLIEPSKIGEILTELQPDILAIYPSNLASVLPYMSKKAKGNLVCAVTHSELSTRVERDRYAKELGVPVLDEYSSVELSRVALELPCGHYHVSEDLVRLDIVDPDSKTPIEEGVGLAVGTNLFSTATPFIRYNQNDHVHIEKSEPCAIHWKQLKKIGGRHNDSFIRPDGSEIPTGTLVDIAYRWMFDTDVFIQEFVMVQKKSDHIVINFFDPNLTSGSDTQKEFYDYLCVLLEKVMGAPLTVEFNFAPLKREKGKKRRQVLREF